MSLWFEFLCFIFSFLTFFSASQGPAASAPAAHGPQSSPKSSSITIGDLAWEPVTDVTIDPSANITFTPTLKNAPHISSASKPLDFFHLFFERALLLSIVETTNKSPQFSAHPLTEQEFLVFLGLIVSMTVYRLSDRRSYWANTTSTTLFPALNFGRYMPRDRFEQILACMQLRVFTPEDLQV